MFTNQEKQGYGYYLQKEDADYILLENGFKIIISSIWDNNERENTVWAEQNKGSSSWTNISI